MNEADILKGLFVNTLKDNCSIHESGLMCYDSLKASNKYELDYKEVNNENREIPGHYDFYVFNYHPWVMSWLNTASLLASIKGKKYTIVLEVAPNNPFMHLNDIDFDGYIVLDPSVTLNHPKVFPFGRPLEMDLGVNIHSPSLVPTIGSFGFPTPGKGFELIVDAVNKEFNKAIIRLNVPPVNKGTEAQVFQLFQRNYTDYLEELCKKIARPGIEIEFTRDFFSKEELINWCGGNTLNCFMYNRYQTGLSATTDQAIASGRPLAVSANETFRHIHRYITPYPYRSLKASIQNSVFEVQQMQNDWSPNAFKITFEKMLVQTDCKRVHINESIIILERIKDNPVLTTKLSLQQRAIEKAKRKIYPLYKTLKNIVKKTQNTVMPEFRIENRNWLPSQKETILFVSGSARKCSIYDFGLNIKDTLQKSSCYHFYYAECNSAAQLHSAITLSNPALIIYNYSPATMPWLEKKIINLYGLPHVGYVHEFDQSNVYKKVQKGFFDYYLFPDPSLDFTGHNNCFKTGRLLANFLNYNNMPAIPTIGSFGFVFSDKGFERLINMVQDEFDEALIRINMPFNDAVDPDGKTMVLPTAEKCRQVLKKPGIKLEITHHYFSKTDVLNFLSANSINAFLYNVDKDQGISSVLDYALSVQRPVAITSAGMFRHVKSVFNDITVENNSLRSIMNKGIAPLVPFFNEWSEPMMIMAYEEIVDKILKRELTKQQKTEESITA